MTESGTVDPVACRYCLCSLLLYFWLIVLSIASQTMLFVPLQIATHLLLFAPLLIGIPSNTPAVRTEMPNLKGIDSSRPLPDFFGVPRKDFANPITMMICLTLLIALTVFMPMSLFISQSNSSGLSTQTPLFFLISVASNVAWNYLSDEKDRAKRKEEEEEEAREHDCVAHRAELVLH